MNKFFEKMKDVIKKSLAFIPWIGFGLMQSMNIPNVIQAVKTGVSMPIASLIMLCLALVCYLIDAIRRDCKLHMVSSSIGITSNLVVLFFVW